MADHDRKSQASGLLRDELGRAARRGPGAVIEGRHDRDGTTRNPGTCMQKYHRVPSPGHRQHQLAAGRVPTYRRFDPAARLGAEGSVRGHSY
jgi:hypothetical protein